MKNKIIIYSLCAVCFILVFSICCIDSDSCAPSIICLICLLYIRLVEFANKNSTSDRKSKGAKKQ